MKPATKKNLRVGAFVFAAAGGDSDFGIVHAIDGGMAFIGWHRLSLSIFRPSTSAGVLTPANT